MQAVSSFGQGSGFQGSQRRDHAVMAEPLWNELPHLRQLKPLAGQQLGSSGGGNHFFDALIGEVTAAAEWLPLAVGQRFAAIMTHSGSRGTGHKLATHYVKLAEQETGRLARGIPKGYEWLDTGSDAGREYLQVMALMGRYAQANHHLIHDLFLQRSGLNGLARYENHHNFAWSRPDGTVVHRKGATPAGKGQVGIIPGSSGTPSYLVEGLGEPASLESSSHGAGRPFSRTEAKRRHDDPLFRQWMAEHDILHIGVSPDETLLAYKDIERVMALQTDLVRPVARLLPTVVIMGGAADDGD
jgi:tRNA-splicing ligase RtcB